jgi:hypothetical protein
MAVAARADLQGIFNAGLANAEPQACANSTFSTGLPAKACMKNDSTLHAGPMSSG